jgi:hypothetical protein
MPIHWRDHIVSTPDTLHGKPRIKGTRIPMKIWTLFCFVPCLICYFGCGGHDGPDIESIDMNVADIEVLTSDLFEGRTGNTPVNVNIVMYGLHRYECVVVSGNVSYRKEGNAIHVAPRVGVFRGEDCRNPPDLAETRVNLWLRLTTGEYIVFGYTRNEYNRPGYRTEWLVFRIEADRIIIVRKSLDTQHEFENRVTLEG